MTFTIALGWWLLPAAATVVALLTAYALDDPRDYRGDYNFGGAFVALIRWGLALIAILCVWLVYFAAAYATSGA